MVILNLIINRIPIEWINHCYTYATYWWDHSWPVEGDAPPPMYQNIKAQCQECVAQLGVPPIIPQYAGWHYTTPHDQTCILIIEDIEEQDGLRTHVDSQWLLIGSQVELDAVGPHQPIAGPSGTQQELASMEAEMTPPATLTTVAAPVTMGAETQVDPTSTIIVSSTTAAHNASPTLPADNAGEKETSSTANMEDVRMGDS